METATCDLCSSTMELIEKKKVIDTEYNVFKCKKCKHMVAKSS